MQSRDYWLDLFTGTTWQEFLDAGAKVSAEVNRPTFSHLSPPLYDMCRFISFTTLKERLQEVAPYVRHLNPSFLDDLSEVCEVEEV